VRSPEDIRTGKEATVLPSREDGQGYDPNVEL